MKSKKMPGEGLFVRPTNIRIKFTLPWEGVVIHKDNAPKWWHFSAGYEFRANVISEDHAAETFDIEIVDSPNLKPGDCIQNLPLLVLVIHAEDVKRIVQENDKKKRQIRESN